MRRSASCDSLAAFAARVAASPSCLASPIFWGNFFLAASVFLFPESNPAPLLSYQFHSDSFFKDRFIRALSFPSPCLLLVLQKRARE
jgi:hypothetical protein